MGLKQLTAGKINEVYLVLNPKSLEILKFVIFLLWIIFVWVKKGWKNYVDEPKIID